MDRGAWQVTVYGVTKSDTTELLTHTHRWEYQTTLLASWETCMHVKKQQLELDMEKQTGIFSPCLLNFCAEYIMWNAARRNISNLRYADDTTFVAEKEEQLKSFLIKMKEESEKVVLKLNIEKTIMASGPIISWQIDGETVETVTGFIFLGFKTTADGDCSYEIKRHLLLGRKVMTNLDSVFITEILLCRLRLI